jgi:hypothetical protein
VLSADDVVDFVRKRRVGFVKQAIFTPELRPPNDYAA